MKKLLFLFFLNISSDTFDRNRLYGGLGYRFSKNVKLEIGYMNHISAKCQ